MNRFGILAFVLLPLAVASCTSAGPGNPVIRPGDQQLAFDESALIDVLPKDAIRSIDDPRMQSQDAAARWLSPVSPVLAVDVLGDARAYPLGILTRHEIVNDTIGGTPIAVTYCPLCNSGVAYERAVGGRTLEFGVSGKLYFSDLVMFDRQTVSLWPQIEGVAVRGELVGTELVPLPSSLISFEDFRLRYPTGRVLARPATRDYDYNPYFEYDSQDGPSSGFFAGTVDDRLASMERVVGVAIEDEAVAYPYDDLGTRQVIEDTVAGTDIVIFWGGDATSALDSSTISDGARVGSSGVFVPRIGDADLSFVVRDGVIVDEQTGSSWSHTGIGTGGQYEGETLEPIHHLDAFWFAWSAFVPITDVWTERRGS